MFDLGGYSAAVIGGLKNTVLVGLSAYSIALILGLLGAWGKSSNLKIFRLIASTYTTVVRGVPELILLLLVYYGLPTLIQDVAKSMGHEVQLDFNPFLSGMLTIGFIYGAFCTEVFRGAFNAIPVGQIESARAMGMHAFLMFRRILLPQAFRHAIPGLSNVWMVLIKATALISLIQLNEIMRMSKIAANATHKPFTAYFLASLLFLAITLASMAVQHLLERKLAKGGLQ